MKERTRYARLEAAAREALAAYKAIGWGEPNGAWTERDRIAFRELAAILDEPTHPSTPMAAAKAA